MSRSIQEGDIVYVYVSMESSIYTLVNRWENPFADAKPRQFKVAHTPSDTGDLWYLEGWLDDIGINLAVNQTSADLDAFVLHLTAKDAEDKLKRLAQGID